MFLSLHRAGTVWVIQEMSNKDDPFTKTMGAKMGEQLRTVREVARVLHVRDKQVRQWVTTGELAVINLGDEQRSNYRISEQDLQAFIASRRVVKEQPQKRSRPSKINPELKRWF